MSTLNPALVPAQRPAQPWYREPYVWLVLGGPLAVIVACIVTVYIAVTHADPVLDRSATPVRVTPAAVETLSPEARTAAELSVMPANQARNHAVTPTLPKD
ncbi:nitrogen fixation protein FixH [Aquabacterium sp. A08]|uniref:nitrogen fixation protein FixH n=1 Tax=Aquabacterium sp. A08 TaxID=2718532 RepID=UPI001423E850|nr:nitrogen fixation protein FixH [Aquabacterium sp. A08]NIC43047.1 nitrogen fixation protein FixH [Aquabacterium sp. A08]